MPGDGLVMIWLFLGVMLDLWVIMGEYIGGKECPYAQD
jgi:hypothetical protein